MKVSALLPCLLFSGLVVFTSCNKSISDNNAVIKDATTMMDIAYGASALQKWMYLPTNRSKNTPVIVLLHGGGFVAGDKSEFTTQSQMLAAKGFAVLNVNYRLVDTIGLFQLPPVHRPSAVKISDQANDIKLAVSFAATKANEWVMSDVKWGICGHSAGGTLALLYGYNYTSVNVDKRVKVTANWAGVTDFSFQDESQFNLLDPRLTELYYRAVGHEPKNVNKLAYMAVSPTWIANTGNGIATLNIRPEFNVVFNTTDESKLLYQQFTNTLTSKGVPNKWVEVAGADHGFGQPGNWNVVVNETADYFKSIYHRLLL